MVNKTIDICKELGQNFIDFSFEANSARAFADARDGLKPGQRACLWEMFDKGYLSNKPHVKSAKIAGAVAGNWWPHRRCCYIWYIRSYVSALDKQYPRSRLAWK